MELEQLLDSITQHSKSLIEKNKELREKLNMLQNDYKKLQISFDAQKNRLEEIENKDKINKIADVLALNKTERKNMLTTINKYIQEIDYCMQLIKE